MGRVYNVKGNKIMSLVSNLIYSLENVLTPQVLYSRKGRFLQYTIPTTLSDDEKEIIRKHFINIGSYEIEINEHKPQNSTYTCTIIDRYVHLNKTDDGKSLTDSFPTPNDVIRIIESVDTELLDIVMTYIKEAIQTKTVEYYHGNWNTTIGDSHRLKIPHSFKLNQVTREAIKKRLNYLDWDRVSVESQFITLYIT